MSARVPILFAGLAAFAGHGGIQGFNRRVVRCLQAEPNAFRAMMLHDTPGNRPNVSGFEGRRGAFSRAVLRAARHADAVLLGHIHLLALVPAMRALNPRLRIVLFAHGIEVWGDIPGRRHLLRRALLPRVDTIAPVSAYTARALTARYKVPPQRCTLFPNAVDPIAPACPRAEPQGEHPLHILTVTRMGTHDRGKNLDRVLAALAKLPAGTVRLTLVGEGPLRPELMALAQDLALGDAVTFAGAVSRNALAQIYQKADLFLLPSAKEGFGIVFLEAMAHGLPVICLDAGGAPEVVRDGETGLCLPPDTGPEGLAAAIDALRRAPDQRRCMGARGYARIASRFSHDQFAKRLARLVAR